LQEPYRKGNFSCPLMAISSSPCACAHGEWKLGWSGGVERVMALDTSYAETPPGSFTTVGLIKTLSHCRSALDYDDVDVETCRAGCYTRVAMLASAGASKGYGLAEDEPASCGVER